MCRRGGPAPPGNRPRGRRWRARALWWVCTRRSPSRRSADTWQRTRRPRSAPRSRASSSGPPRSRAPERAPRSRFSWHSRRGRARAPSAPRRAGARRRGDARREILANLERLLGAAKALERAGERLAILGAAIPTNPPFPLGERPRPSAFKHHNSARRDETPRWLASIAAAASSSLRSRAVSPELRASRASSAWRSDLRGAFAAASSSALRRSACQFNFPKMFIRDIGTSAHLGLAFAAASSAVSASSIRSSRANNSARRRSDGT